MEEMPPTKQQVTMEPIPGNMKLKMFQVEMSNDLFYIECGVLYVTVYCVHDVKL